MDYMGEGLVKAVDEFNKINGKVKKAANKDKDKLMKKSEKKANTLMNHLSTCAFANYNSFLLYKKKSEKCTPFVVIMTKTDKKLNLSTLGSYDEYMDEYMDIIKMFAERNKFAVEETKKLESAELIEQLIHNNTIDEGQTDSNNYIEAEHGSIDDNYRGTNNVTVNSLKLNMGDENYQSTNHSGSSTETNETSNISSTKSIMELDFLQTPFNDVIKSEDWPQLMRKVKRLLGPSTEIKSSGKVNDNCVLTGTYLMEALYSSTLEKEKKDCYILNLNIVQGLIDKEVYTPIARTKRKLSKNIDNPLDKKLYMVPMVGNGHFSLLCFWRLDLLYTDKATKACILWLDPLNNSHCSELARWRNVIS
jgi:hypothetical protein